MDWFLEQKKGISGKSGEIQMKHGAEFTVMLRCWFLSCDNSGRYGEGSAGILRINFSTFL